MAELMARRGIYHGMVVRQATAGAKDADSLELRDESLQRPLFLVRRKKF